MKEKFIPVWYSSFGTDEEQEEQIKNIFGQNNSGKKEGYPRRSSSGIHFRPGRDTAIPAPDNRKIKLSRGKAGER